MSKTKPKLIIIDGNALIHRSFHALPQTMRTKSGQVVNAVYGFTAFLLKALSEFKPEFVILTLDKKGPTFRHEEYAAYKATRVKAPDELYNQIPLVKEVAEAFDIPVFEKQGFEADDLIGTVCDKAGVDKQLEKIIITGDLDTLQLADEATRIYTMSRGLSESVLYGPAEIMARYGLKPAQLVDYKALRGDPSDNIPGVKGIGEKTAAAMIASFQNLDKLYQAAEKSDKRIPVRTRELLIQDKDNAYLSQRLAKIDRQAPIDFSLKKLQKFSFNSEKVINLFSQLEFKSLLPKVKRLKEVTGGRIEAEADQTQKREKVFYDLVGDEKSFKALLKKLSDSKKVAIAVSVSPADPLRGQLLGLAFSFKPGQASAVSADEENLARLRPYLENGGIKKVGHDLKLSWRALKLKKIELRGLSLDTMVASYLLDPGHRQHDLESLAFSELGLDIARQEGGGAKKPQLDLGLDFSADFSQNFSKTGQTADLAGRLAEIFTRRLSQEKMKALLEEIEIPLIPVLGSMENYGIRLEPEKLESLSRKTAKDLNNLEKKIWQEAGGEFNINSTKQLKEILFEKLAIPTDGLKKTKTGFSTAEDELEKIKELHPLVSLIQSYRELAKLQTTYLEALPRLLNPKTGRIHTSFNQTIAATGRLSSTEPNLQNIPTRTEAGREIRAAFTAPHGWKLASLDYSQIELRLAAHMSGDQKMIRAFKNGEDIHQATAAEINKVPLDKVTKAMRSEAKATNFGILYGQGAHGLSQAAGIPYWQATEFIKKYFQAYPKIKKMVDASIKEARIKGYALTLFGRKRPLPDLNSQIPAVRKAAERMAINTPLQGTAADLIKLAMIEAAKQLAGHEDEARLLLQIHDELIFEIREDKLDEYLPRLEKAMQPKLKLKVPIVIEATSGRNWGELK